ncbi:MAG: hypothetical protein H8F28_08460 [Fibrella sp.]|nr:hypothetical protein [Armatimonadota bacterium]
MSNKQTAVAVRKKNIILVASVTVMLAGLVIWRVLSGPSPEEIRENAIRALEKGDAEALCALADPEEIKLTGLSPKKVKTLLDSTLWENGLPRQIKVGKRMEGAVDQGFWYADWDNKPGKYRVVVLANDHPKNGWHLNLSWMLYSICVWKNGDRGADSYYAFARENSVTGFRHQSGVYNNPRYFADLGKVASVQPPRPL